MKNPNTLKSTSLFWLICSNIFLIVDLSAQADLSWFADPLRAGFSYTSNLGAEEQASSWQPGAFDLYLDDNYDSGLHLGVDKLQIKSYMDMGGTRVLRNRAVIGLDQFYLQDDNAQRLALYLDGMYVRNDAGWSTVRVRTVNSSGQIDLYNGGGTNYLAQLKATSSGSGQGELKLFGNQGLSKIDLSVDNFDEGTLSLYGSSGVRHTFLGSVLGNEDGTLLLYNNLGQAKIQMFYDGQNKGRVQSDMLVGGKIEINGSNNAYAGSFDGGLGLKLKSQANSVPDLVLEANGIDDLDGVIGSDPNFSNSNLQLKSMGNVTLELDTDDNANGLHLFQIRNSDEDLVTLSKDGGLFLFNTSDGVDNPHMVIRDETATGYARLNFKNLDPRSWQIAGRPTETPYLLFHLTEADGSVGDDIFQLRGDGDAWLRGSLTPNKVMLLVSSP